MDYRFRQACREYGLFRVIVTFMFSRFMLPLNIEVGKTVNVNDGKLRQSRRRKIISLKGDFNRTVIRYIDADE